MPKYSAVILGGGMSGLSAAYALASAGSHPVLLVERAADLGGLAGSFEHGGRCYPLGYHHILHRDRTLLRFLDLIGALPNVRWRRIRMLFETSRGLLDLGAPLDFARFPLPLRDKLCLVRLMLRAYRKSDWSDWKGRSAAELVDSWGSRRVRETLFEPLCRLKFEMCCESVSAAWLGARLHFREGTAPLGYIPNTNWTKVLCDGMADLVRRAGVETRVATAVRALHASNGRVVEAELGTGERVAGDVFVSTVPVDSYLALRPDDRTRSLSAIRYTGLISAVCGAPSMDLPHFYWLNLSSGQSTACGIFRLDALNPTIGSDAEICLNFVTHLHSRERPLFSAPDETLIARYRDDFRRVFGCELQPSWIHISRVGAYSPIFDREFENPPVRSETWQNVYFAGNYRTFPSVASTGTAIRSGLNTAAAILRGAARALPRELADRAMPAA